jgi:hypothetical protein
MDPVRVHWPVAGSYISADERLPGDTEPFVPPVTSTRPSASRVAVAPPYRSSTIDPIVLNRPFSLALALGIGLGVADAIALEVDVMVALAPADAPTAGLAVLPAQPEKTTVTIQLTSSRFVARKGSPLMYSPRLSGPLRRVQQ